MSEQAAAGRRGKITPEELAARIREAYNTAETPFAFITGGFRRIAVDHADRRAQMQLLRFGRRYHSKVQLIVHELNRLFEPDVFIDVGANYGECLFSLPPNARTPVLGFEANPVLLSYLERSKIYNDDLAVEVVGKAVGSSSEGSISFFVNKRWSGKSTASRAAVADGMTEITVPLTSIDTEVSQRFPDARSVVMKVDVEGFEPEVLAGAASTIADAEFFVCLLEFDDTLIEGRDAGARAFFDRLAAQFDVYLTTAKTVDRITAYEALERRARNKAGNIHCDLLLLKASPEQRGIFEERFRGITTQAIASEVWGLPAA